MKALRYARRHDPLGHHPAERIRRDQLSRVIKKLDLSSEGEEAVERLSYSLAASILLNLVPEVMACAEDLASREERDLRPVAPACGRRPGTAQEMSR